ncbi:hypothetical protein CFE70_004497 [Pyrenophora teres f. teres 0-1]|nr:hypothetical protein HRS9122_03091 [Pyrenophora teres f. teres]
MEHKKGNKKELAGDDMRPLFETASMCKRQAATWSAADYDPSGFLQGTADKFEANKDGGEIRGFRSAKKSKTAAHKTDLNAEDNKANRLEKVSAEQYTHGEIKAFYDRINSLTGQSSKRTAAKYTQLAPWVSEGYANKTSSGEKKIISESDMRLAYKKPVVRCREEKGAAFIPLMDRRYNRKKVAAKAKASSARSKDLFNPFTTPRLPDVLPGGTYLFITNIPRVQQQPEPHDGDPAPAPRREEIAKFVRLLVKRV